MEFKITEKTNKTELVAFLKGSKVKSKDLAGRIKYAVDMFKKDMKKVTRQDLVDLAQEVIESLTPVQSPVEASLKPRKKVKEEEPEPEDGDEDDDTEDVKEETKKPEKTTSKTGKGGKKTDSDKEVDTVPPVSNKGVDCLPSASVFPKSLEHPELGKLVSCAGHYKSFEEVAKALNEEKTLYFACYWSKAQIKKYDYVNGFAVNADNEVFKTGFPLNLDIAMAVLACETIERVWAMSQYTEAMFMFNGDSFEPVEDVDPRSGKKFSVRVSLGMEFEIYRPEDEEI